MQDTQPIVSPWWKSRTFYSSALVFLTGLPTFIHDVDAIIPDGLRPAVRFIFVLSMALSAWFARSGGVEGATKVNEKLEQAKDAVSARVEQAVEQAVAGRTLG